MATFKKFEEIECWKRGKGTNTSNLQDYEEPSL